MILEDFLPRGTENPPSWFWDEKRRFWNRLGQLLHGSSDLTWVWMRFLRGFDIEKDKTAPLRSYKYKGHGQLMLPMHNRQKKINPLPLFALFSHLSLLSVFITAAWLVDWQWWHPRLTRPVRTAHSCHTPRGSSWTSEVLGLKHAWS